MGVDKSTKPNFVNIVFDGKKEYLDVLREQAEKDDQNYDLDEGVDKKLSITSDNHSVDTDEYYFDDGNIWYSASLDNSQGSAFYTVELPLSDEVLVDVLQYAIKRLNKLKTAVEVLK